MTTKKNGGDKKKTAEQMIEDLAISVGKGFEALTKEVREGFAAADRRLARIELGTTGLANRLAAVEDRVLQLARKVGLQFNK